MFRGAMVWVRAENRLSLANNYHAEYYAILCSKTGLFIQKTAKKLLASKKWYNKLTILDNSMQKTAF